jgi:dGTPase
LPDPNEGREERLFPDSSPDNRTPFQRDRDRVLYTSAFHRLTGITQVASADEGHVFHNRLTHTLEVAQVARRIAEKLATNSEAAKLIDPDVAESCALIHDLGHPPFGHVAEKELDSLVADPELNGNDPDGFEGNAQSFRIVAKLALRSFAYDGLNLTRAVLNGSLKYPWPRHRGEASSLEEKKKGKKWGTYRSEADCFSWTRKHFENTPDEQSVEAQIMDWADDVTYAIHDASDFFKAGLVPLDRLASSDFERKTFYEASFARTDWQAGSDYSQSELIAAFENLANFIPINQKYSGTKEDRTTLRIFTAGRIGECVKDVHYDIPSRKIRVKDERKKEITMLKQLTWHYVILNPSMATKQFGQKKIVRELFQIFHGSAVSKGNMRMDLGIFPRAYRDLMDASTTDVEKTRLVADMIAGMTEQQAISIHRKLSGTNLGSILDLMNR